MAISFCEKVLPYELDEGVDFKDFVGRHNGAADICTGIAIFQPDASLPLHMHSCEESVTILEGEALCDIGGELIPLRPFDTSFVPPRVPHRFLNASGTDRLIILWAYSTADVDRIVIESNEIDPQLKCKSAKYSTPSNGQQLRI